MAQQGWIKLHRVILNNKLWVKESFTKGQAWVDILLRINHKNNKVLIGNQTIDVLKGQTLWSMKEMAERWIWSRKKVRLFLEMLEKEQQINFKSTTKYTIITIINWNIYQSEIQQGTSNVKEEYNKGTTKEQQKNTNKNDNNEKTDKKNIYMDLNFIDEVVDNVKITQGQYDKLVNKFNKDIVHKNIIGLDNYIANGKGDKYKDHYRVLNTWCNKEKVYKSNNNDKNNSWSGAKQFN